MKTTKESTWKCCATCARWGGSRRPADPYCYRVEYESEQRGKCYGGDFHNMEVAPTTFCKMWEQQYKKY